MTAVRPLRSLAWFLVALSAAVPVRGQTALAGPDDASPRDARVRPEVTPCLNLRISPSAASGIVDCLDPETSLTLFESREGWSRVRLAGGLQGWVATRFLEVPPVASAQGSAATEPSDGETAVEDTVVPEPAAAPVATVQARDIAFQDTEDSPGTVAFLDTDTSQSTEAEIVRLRAELEESRENEARLRQELEATGLPEAELLEELVRLRVVVSDLRVELDEVRRAELRLRDQLAATMAAEPEESPGEPRLVAVRAPLAIESAEPMVADSSAVPVDTDLVRPVTEQDERPGAAELSGLVGAWASAWSERRADDYLSFYAEDFVPEGYPSRPMWEAARREELASAAFIVVEVEAVEIGPESPEGEVEVRFAQYYESDAYRDRVTRLLVFIVEDGAWKIVREEVLDAVPAS